MFENNQTTTSAAIPPDKKAVLAEIGALSQDLERIKEERASYDSVTQELDLKKTELVKLKENLAKYNDLIEDLHTKKETLEKEVSLLNSNLFNARTFSINEIVHLESKRNKATDEVAAIDQIILEKNKTVDSLTKQIILIQNELNNVTRETITKKAELDRSISEREDEINALNTRIAELEKSVKGLEEKVSLSKALDQEIQNKAAIVSDLDRRVREDSDKLIALQNEHAKKEELFNNSLKQKSLELDERAGDLSILASSLKVKEEKLQHYKILLEEKHGKPFPKLVI